MCASTAGHASPPLSLAQMYVGTTSMQSYSAPFGALYRKFLSRSLLMLIELLLRKLAMRFISLSSTEMLLRTLASAAVKAVMMLSTVFPLVLSALLPPLLPPCLQPAPPPAPRLESTANMPIYQERRVQRGPAPAPQSTSTDRGIDRPRHRQTEASTDRGAGQTTFSSGSAIRLRV
jgi:hypothetical protein